MESHESDELKAFEDLVARSRAETPPKVDVRLDVEAALGGESLKTFEALARKSRREPAPAVDVRLLVQAALRMSPRPEPQMDWMDVLVKLFRLPQVRVAMTACFVALSIAASVAQQAETASPPASQEIEDPLMAFLVQGE